MIRPEFPDHLFTSLSVSGKILFVLEMSRDARLVTLQSISGADFAGIILDVNVTCSDN